MSTRKKARLRESAPAAFAGVLSSALLFACGGGAPVVQGPPQSTATVPQAIAVDPETLLDLPTRYKHAYVKATDAASAGNFKKARAALEAVVPAAAKETDSDVEFWLHNELTWVRWADGDLTGALSEVDAAKAALDRSRLDEPSKKRLKLHELWDRAYIDLEISVSAPAENRDALFSKADDVRNEYQELALAENDHDGMTVLEAFFAVRKNDGHHAKLAAKRVDLDQDSDLQDLYVIGLALELGGDTAAAQNVRARICSGREYLMKPLLVSQLAHDGHACEASEIKSSK